jgi:DNA-binding transcriptional MerR regulator
MEFTEQDNRDLIKVVRRAKDNELHIKEQAELIKEQAKTIKGLEKRLTANLNAAMERMQEQQPAQAAPDMSELIAALQPQQQSTQQRPGSSYTEAENEWIFANFHNSEEGNSDLWRKHQAHEPLFASRKGHSIEVQYVRICHALQVAPTRDNSSIKDGKENVAKFPDRKVKLNLLDANAILKAHC